MSRKNPPLDNSSSSCLSENQKEQDQAQKEELFRKLWAEHADIIQSQDYKRYCHTLLLQKNPTEPFSPRDKRAQMMMARKKKQAEQLTTGKTYKDSPQSKVLMPFKQFSMSEEGQIAVQFKKEEQGQQKMYNFNF